MIKYPIYCYDKKGDYIRTLSGLSYLKKYAYSEKKIESAIDSNILAYNHYFSNIKLSNLITKEEYPIIVNDCVRLEDSTKKLLEKIAATYSNEELKALSKGSRLLAGTQNVPTIDFDGAHIKFGYITDTHLGSIYTSEQHLELINKTFKRENVDFIMHSGDVTDGFYGNRPEQVYELSHIGYDKQKEYAIQVLNSFDKQIYVISGNHDVTFMKSSGANIVQDICSQNDNLIYLGHDIGSLNLKDKANVMLWHGNDGSSYATSYRLQKIVESFTGGTKPHLLLAGHTHKQVYLYDRHVHVLSGGSVQMQTSWMRGKKLASHTGFWIVDLWVNDRGISKMQPTWYPFYA